MNDYILKKGEVLNGGYTIKIGSYTLKIIGAYKPVWTKVYDEENAFTDYLGNTDKQVLGLKFSLQISTGGLSVQDCEALVAELNKPFIEVECADFNGVCLCDNAPADLKQANYINTRYSLSFTLTAKNLITISSGFL